MSFHPLMPYGKGWHESERVLLEEGAPFTFTPERAAQLRRFAAGIRPSSASRRCWPRSTWRRSSRGI